MIKQNLRNVLFQFTIMLFATCIITSGLNTNASNPNLNDFNLSQEQPPNLRIIQIGLDKSLPEEGDIVKANIQIKNNDPVFYNGTKIQITITELFSERRMGEEKEIGSKIVNSIDPNTLLEVIIEFEAQSGQYLLTALIYYNNLPIPESINTIEIQVLSPPLGDNITPIIGLLGILLFILLLILGQSFYDMHKLNRHNKYNKSN